MGPRPLGGWWLEFSRHLDDNYKLYNLDWSARMTDGF
jgi:hypothetical protein